MSYYPPKGHRIEVCACCHTVRDNPLHSRVCCKSPDLHTYERVDAPACIKVRGSDPNAPTVTQMSMFLERPSPHRPHPPLSHGKPVPKQPPRTIRKSGR